MLFEIDYARDITLVKCEEYGTLTVIIRDDKTGNLVSADVWCPDHRPDVTSDAQSAVNSAMGRAQCCVKYSHKTTVVHETGDKYGFFWGHQESSDYLIKRYSLSRRRS